MPTETLLRDALLAYAHHVPLFTLLVALAAEWVLLMAPLDLAGVRRLARIDGVYGASAGLLLLAGAGRLAFGAKGWAFYAGNPIFWAKLGLFAAIGLISIVPTLRYQRWRRAATPPDDSARVSVRRWVHAQAGLLLVIPLMAALMARGIGH